MYDAIVIGGGPAGLQAALTLARVHRSTLLLDSGSYRNAPAHAMHNFLGLDGTPPAELRAAARADLARYDTVEVRDVAATTVRQVVDRFAVHTADGDLLEARRIVLATGVRDVLPHVPGLAELWGTVVAHCPFCHGHELAGGTIVVQGSGHAPMLARMLAGIARDVALVEDGFPPEPADLAALQAIGVRHHTASVSALRPEGDGAVVVLDDGTEVHASGVFARTTFEQAAPFAAQLGLDLLPSGCIEVDAFGQTSLPGVFAAGDLAHTAALPMPMASVLNAAAAGQVAGARVHQDLLVSAAAAAA